VKVELEAVELVGELDDGTTYRYWTFDGKVPAPMVRVRVGDTVEVMMKNRDDSWMMHNVDFHAVTGPGGGAHATMTDPGGKTGFTFTALKPGLYVYHCATPMVAQHIANGMYGMILVEPEQGLAPVDREFHVMQGEIYTEERFGTSGELMESYDKLIDERPEYYVFNGSVHGLKTKTPLQAKVGETIRIFFGVGGPNKTSAFHVIGEIFDQVYALGSVTGASTPDVQTVSLAPGGAMVAEMTLDVPGRYVLVDHALSRVERGLAAILEVEGPANPAVFDDTPPSS
jgi:nitrite reductase (NO-forming)